MLFFTACSKEDVDAIQIQDAYIVDSAYSDNTKIYNYVYPSSDPTGKPVMLSGVITMGSEVSRSDSANGLLLYNRYTIFRADECPSSGNLSVQKRMSGSGLITISADYYGFGVTEKNPQAFGMGCANAQSSIDALIAAKKLLTAMGFKWRDNIFNAGYSQGGQTAMAVVRLVAEHYPEIDFTYTFAGGGSYDLATTYSDIIEAGVVDMPSTVAATILALNDFHKLGMSYSEMFSGELANHVDDWIRSKRYTRQQIDRRIGSHQLADFLSADMTDINSTAYQRLISAIDVDNLCSGWTPRGDEHIMLVHHTKDSAVPASNATKMYQFLVDSGVEDVELHIDDYYYNTAITAHESAGAVFMTLTIAKISSILDIDPWTLL